MNTDTYPKGTTKEQWDRYQEAELRHKKFINNYRFFLDRIVRHLDWSRPNSVWTTGEIERLISSEIDRASSMDAPNKPGYYRANND